MHRVHRFTEYKYSINVSHVVLHHGQRSGQKNIEKYIKTKLTTKSVGNFDKVFPPECILLLSKVNIISRFVANLIVTVILEVIL